ncbi:MAG: lysylphosphatidylglycerol synthase transmembrane domain-containing protein [Fibrobacteraceae bacterium]
MSPRIKATVVFFLKCLVTVVPAYFVYKNITSTPGWDSSDLESLFLRMNYWPLIIASGCLVVSNFTGCYQWKLLLERQKVRMPYFQLVKLYFVGLFFNNFMPGNVGGDVKKVYDIRMQGGQTSIGAGFTATFFDRLFGLFFLNVLALVVGVLFFIYDPEQRWFLLPSLWVFLGFCAFFAALFSRRLGRILSKGTSKIFPVRVQERFLRMQERFQSFREGRLWWHITLLSAFTQVLRVLVHFFCGLALGLDIAVSWYFFYIPMVAVVSALPVSIGGFGPRELLAQSLFAKAGVPSLESVFIQLLAYLTSLIVSLLGAFFFLTGKGARVESASTVKICR